MRRLLHSVVMAAAALATVVACSAGTVSVDKDKVAEEVSKQLKAEVGRAPQSIVCPGDLQGEVGKTMRCELDDSGETYGVTVTVTKVEGTNVKFDIKVDDAPQ